MCAGPKVCPTYASLFARIPGDWKHDWVPFANACRRVRWEGPQCYESNAWKNEPGRFEQV